MMTYMYSKGFKLGVQEVSSLFQVAQNHVRKSACSHDSLGSQR